MTGFYLPRHLLILLLIGCTAGFATGQNKTVLIQEPHGFQYGFSFKATVEGGRQAKPGINLRLSINAGVASDFIDRWLYPSLNTEFQFYNGGFGSKNDKGKAPFCLDVITALTATAGIKNRQRPFNANDLESRNVPLYYFANFVHPALQNPFDHSLSVGTNFIFSTDCNKTSQRIGFFNLHVGKVQLSYYNDGGWPFADIYLGDRRDRYYTGGGTLSYNGRRYNLLETIELGYYKYTGYTKSAFEVSNKMNLAYVNYRKPEQKKYNRSLWSFNVANPSRGIGINLRTFNYLDQDIQHKIHWGLFDAYHIVPYPAHWVVNASYYNSYNKIGLR
jgi:Bacterial toxin 23